VAAQRTRRSLSVHSLEDRVAPAAGQLDPTFGNAGRVTTAFGAADDIANAAVVQPDGKLVVAGQAWNGTNWDFALARYNPDGSLDTSFDTDGKVTTNFVGGHDVAMGVALMPDGRIVAGGYSFSGNYDFAVARYNADGSPDNTFDSDGRATLPVGAGDDVGQAIALQSDGSIVVTGYTDTAGNFDMAVARFQPNGSPDSTFGPGGKRVTTFGGADERGYAVAIQADGKIVVAGRAGNGTGEDYALSRYLTDGTLDPAFDTDGKVTTPIGAREDDAYAVALLPGGKILAGGHTFNGANYDFSMAQYKTDGSLDTSFGTGGTLVTDFASGSDDRIYGLFVQPDGKIVATGAAGPTTDHEYAIARYTATGSLDPSLDTDGRTRAAVGTGADYPFGAARYSDGRVVVVGQSDNGFNQDFGILRFSMNAAPVASLGSAGGTFTENGSPVVVFPNITLSDADSATLAGATVKIGSYVHGQDVLAFGALPGGVAATFDVDTGVLTFAGTATLSAYRDLLRSVTYRDSSEGPNVAPRTLSVQINDGNLSDNLSTTLSTTVAVIARNDAPSLIDDGVVPAVLQGTTTPAGRKVAALFGGLFTDADPGDSLAGIAVIANPLVAGEGSWQYSTDNGGNWFEVNSVADGPSALALSAATRIRFLPTATFHGDPAPLSVRALDSTFGAAFTVGAARQLVDTTATGGLTAIAAGTVAIVTTIWPSGTGAGGANTAPTLSGVPISANRDEGLAFTFTASATDPDVGQALAFNLAGAPVGASIDPDTGEFTWTPTEAQGPDSFVFQVRVTDGVATVTQSITVVVRELNGAPVLAGVPPTASVDRGVILAFTASASDTDLVNGVNNTLTYSLVGAPVGANIDPDTGAFSWTPAANTSLSAYPFQVRVMDDGVPARSDTQSIVVTVTGNTPPTLSAVPSLVTIDEEQLLTFTATANDPDGGQTLTFSLAGHPAGATINPASGLFSWTPLEDQGPGTLSFQVRVSDGFAITSLPITVIVREVNLPPVLTGIPANATTVRGVPVTLTASATDPDLLNGVGNTLTYSLVGAPAGAMIDPDTGAFTWTPGELDALTDYPIKVRVVDDGVPAKSSTQTILVSVLPIAIVNDDLLVGATGGKDTISISPSKDAAALVVTVNKVVVGTIPVDLVLGRIIVHGLGGADKISISPKLAKPADLYGDAGNDALTGGAGSDRLFGGPDNDKLIGGLGNDVLVGGDGNDNLSGGFGLDVLIGGRGTDKLAGGDGDDVLFGGSTMFDVDPTGLLNIVQEWATEPDYDTRINHLTGTPGGLNLGTVLTTGSTIFDDGVKDKLSGDKGRDWFIMGSLDLTPGRTPDETITIFAT
jgi:uncharacterized delta-60 repeat protein